MRKGLVIGPLNVVKDTWPDEMMTWKFARRLTYAVCVGSEEQRRAALDIEADLLFVNRENVKWLVQTMGYRWFRRFGVLIYDEASRLKGAKKKTKPTKRKDGTVSEPRTSEYEYVYSLARRMHRAWLLSGTPCTNGLIDLYGPVSVIDEGQRLGRSLSAFRERWFTYDSYKRTYNPTPPAEDEIMSRLKDVMYVLKEEDHLKDQVPELIVRDRWVHLPPNAMEVYRRMERDMVLEEFDVEAVNSGVLSNKLLQLANGSIYAPDDDIPEGTSGMDRPPVARFVHDRKLVELESVFQEAGGAPVLVGYSFRFDIHSIKKKFPWVRVFGETPTDVQDWNAGRIRCLAMHPASASHGLNIQRGGNLAVWYGLPWSLELYQQFIRRLARRGQPKSHVRLTRILARHTRDERTSKVLSKRALDQERVTDRVRIDLDKMIWELDNGNVGRG